MKRIFLAACLALSAAARAEVPGGHLYLGLGGELLGSRVGAGAALSLEAQVELGRFFVGGTYLMGGASRSGMPKQGILFLGPRAGYFFTDNPGWAPYVSLGYGIYGQGEVLFDDAASTNAFMPEVGVAFLRGNRWGRFTASLQGFFVTSHDVANQKPQYNRLDDWAALTLRAML